MSNTDPQFGSPEHTSLPQISEGVLKRFLDSPPDFETLYKKLREDNPQTAGWLLAITERIAPADAQEKERYGKVALLLYGMLSDQADINQLERQLAIEVPAERAETDENVPPASIASGAGDGA